MLLLKLQLARHTKTEVSNEDIRKALNDRSIDYLQCWPIQADLSGDSFSTSSYNRANGDGAAQRVIAALRNSAKK